MSAIGEVAGFCLALNVFAAGLVGFHNSWTDNLLFAHVGVALLLIVLGEAVSRRWIVSSYGYVAGLCCLGLATAVGNQSAADAKVISRAALTTSAAWYASAVMQPTLRFAALHIIAGVVAAAVITSPAGDGLLDAFVGDRVKLLKRKKWWGV